MSILDEFHITSRMDKLQIQPSCTNYVSYIDPRSGRNRIGHYDISNKTIVPLSFVSGTPIDDLYQVIEVGDSNIIKTESAPIPRSATRILPPITGRDILCVGKNYAEHAKEFNQSGFDSSDKVDQPTHPVIFTKRFTSIIADGEEIYPHPEFTQTADYEGEIGVIIGTPGTRIREQDAMNHVWGYTIINDMTARERQRDHKQFYIGKSPDTFCPMGPIAVPAHKLDKVLRVQTHVNGELRQDATTDDLIFSIPYLIKTMSEGQTLTAGDVLATGTPAGVGIGRNPPIYLKPGDVVSVSINGLGTLTNKIAYSHKPNPTLRQIRKTSHLKASNTAKAASGFLLTEVNNKPLYYKHLGKLSGPPIFFVHGLGGTNEFFMPLIQELRLKDTYSLHLYDLEGHGLSPTSPLSKLSIESFAKDLNAIFQFADVNSGAIIIGLDLGSVVAAQFAALHPNKVSKLLFIDPPFPSAARQELLTRAEAVRTNGIAAIIDVLDQSHIYEENRVPNPIATAAVRLALLGQDPEGYAKACTALSEASYIELKEVQAKMSLLSGVFSIFASSTTTTPGEDLNTMIQPGRSRIFEDLKGTVDWVRGQLGEDE